MIDEKNTKKIASRLLDPEFVKQCDDEAHKRAGKSGRGCIIATTYTPPPRKEKGYGEEHKI